MKILVIDHNDLSFQQLKAKLVPMGHQISYEAIKNNAVEKVVGEHFDVVFYDPAPLTSARSVVLSIRRMIKNYPYMLLMSETATRDEAIKSGTNDIMNKPLDPAVFEEKLDNAVRLLELMKHVGDDSEDFPSAGGVIAKSAMNQLFLSAMDRADRYGERTYMLFITIDNYKAIKDLDGPKAAAYATARLSQEIVLQRRQSDIIGQTGQNEFVLLLQRPVYETEPVEAANRFGEVMAGFKAINQPGVAPVEIGVRLISLPVGAKMIEHLVKPPVK